MATYAQFKHVELYKIGHGKNRVPNAPKSSIGEIFSSDSTDGGLKLTKSGSSPRPRTLRDTPTRPRDTHSRLFGQVAPSPPAPMMTDTIRSHIQFGEAHCNGTGNGTGSASPASPSPKLNGSVASTPSRGETDAAQHLSYSPPRRNPVTGDGVPFPLYRRRHPAACLQGADPQPGYPVYPPVYPELEPRQIHRYHEPDWPIQPAHYPKSTAKPVPFYQQTPYSLIGLHSGPECAPRIDPDSLYPQPILDRHWPPLPGQYNIKPVNPVPHHPLSPHSHVGMTSALAEKPTLDYKYNPVPTLDGLIDPYLISNLDPPHALFKYERDGPIPDVSLLQTPVAPGPHTLCGFPPIFHKYVPGYLYGVQRRADEFSPMTYYLDYARRRDMEGNPITGDGYKSMNGEINTVTALNGHSSILHNRVPPGGFSSGLW